MIKVGLIGCGALSSSFISAFEEIPDANITAAADLVEANLNAVCQKCGATGYRDYKEMVKSEELDFVIIALPHFLHREATCFCAEAGVNVFLEKPMALNSQECDEMIAACEKHKVMLWVGHIQRYFGGNLLAKELIDSGKLGKLVSFTEIRNLNYFSDSRPRWFLSKKLSGGGIMINLGAHTLDKLKFFCDGATVEEITGQVHIREGFDCEDSSQCFVKMSNGVTATINLVGHTAAEMYRTILYLTHGEIRIRGNNVEYCTDDGEFITVAGSSKNAMQLQMELVCDSIRSGKPLPLVTGEYGKDVIHAVKRLYGEE